MKFRSLAFLLPLGGLLSLPLSAQDQASSNTSGAPQTQQSPPPSSSLPGTQASATPRQPQASDSTNSALSTNPSTPVLAPDPAAPAPNSGLGSPGQPPPPSDPNSLIPPPAEPEQPSPINTAGNEEKQRQEQKARYYSVKVRADKDEDLVSLQDKADKARSDESKRQALRQYYDLLAKRMKKLDPDLSQWIDTMHAAYMRRLEQTQIEPTIPANPPPTAEAISLPTPAPSPPETPSRHKKKKRASASPTPGN